MGDKEYMQIALNLALKGGRNAAPNPMVGSIIVYKDEIIGKGYHQKCGEAHAEVNAVNSVKDKSLLPFSTIYVTLEPCAHYGKTPPCADLIVQHQFKRCVIACTDTFSEVSGKGIERIKAAGIEVELNILNNEAREINKRFFTFHEKQRPYIILKWAQTQDGFIDKKRDKLNSGINWITQTATKKIVHKWRSQEQAILVGWKTIENDNASLTVREVEGINPLRCIIDPNNSISEDKTIFHDGIETLVFNRSERNELPAHIHQISSTNLDAQFILDQLYNKNILSVFVEGGAYTHQQFIDNDLWDEARVLTGVNSFYEGIKAPSLKIKQTETIELGLDTLSIYKPHKN